MSGRRFKTTVVDTKRSELLDVIDSHKQDEIIKSLKRLPEEARRQVKSVSVDMWAGFINVAKSVFPQAVIVIDRFHVVKPVLAELKKITRQSGLKKFAEQSLILKNGKSLTLEQREQLEKWLSKDSRLRKAYDYKEQFHEIYESKQSVEEGRRRIEEWLNIAREVYGEVISTIRNHITEISNYFIARHTSGVTEGLNTKIKLIKRQGYGYKSFASLRARLLACCSGKTPSSS
jgi:transposase